MRAASAVSWARSLRKKTAAAAVGLLAGAGCGPGALDYSTFERFAFAQMPAEGFFVDTTLAYRATLGQGPDGITFRASVLRSAPPGARCAGVAWDSAGQTTRDVTLPPPPPGCVGGECGYRDGGLVAHTSDVDCFEEEALPPRRLSQAEAARVRTTFSRLERVRPDPGCGAIDPGGARVYTWDGREHTDAPCGDLATGPVADLIRTLTASTPMHDTDTQRAVAVARERAAPLLRDSPGLRLVRQPTVEVTDSTVVVTWGYDPLPIAPGPAYAARVVVDRRTMRAVELLVGS